jgi:hypothetical protein
VTPVGAAVPPRSGRGRDINISPMIGAAVPATMVVGELVGLAVGLAFLGLLSTN